MVVPCHAVDGAFVMLHTFDNDVHRLHFIIVSITTRHGVKVTNFKAKAKDLAYKAKAKDLSSKAKDEAALRRCLVDVTISTVVQQRKL